MSRNIKYLVVHCTATSQKATVTAIKMGWKRLGWKNPGYHIIIQADGTAIELLDEDLIANGVAGFNATSLHVSYIGGIDPAGKPVDNRTKAQKDALYVILCDWKERYPKARILGHRDFSKDLNGNGRIDRHERMKECPCFDAIPEYADI